VRRPEKGAHPLLLGGRLVAVSLPSEVARALEVRGLDLDRNALRSREAQLEEEGQASEMDGRGGRREEETRATFSFLMIAAFLRGIVPWGRRTQSSSDPSSERWRARRAPTGGAGGAGAGA
jgi:hypothetical protein